MMRVDDKEELKSAVTRVDNVIYLPKLSLVQTTSAVGEVSEKQSKCLGGICSIEWKPRKPAA